MVQIQPSASKQKPQEDKSELLNSTVSSEVIQSKNGAICSACCLFVSACLFIVYLTIVILMSWILRGYIYANLKHFLRIDSIYDLNVQYRPNSNYLNPSGFTYELSKSSPYPFEINLKPLDNIYNEKNTPELKQEKNDHTFLDQNLLDKLDNGEEFMNSPQIIGTDTLSDIISNMSDFILNELEMVEESLKSDVEKFGDGSLKMNDIDLFADDIISNISHILEEEIKIVEESIKSNIPMKKEFPSDRNADSSKGFMGFLGEIFGHHNVRHESIENSDIEDRAEEKYAYNSFSPRLEHRFDLQEPMPEPYNDHNYLESSEDIILNKAVKSIRNLFGENKNTSPDVVKVLLKPDEQHIRYKVMLLEYLEIFGLVLAAMTFITFVLFLIISRIIGYVDQREMIKRHKLEESIIVNDKDQHVI